MRLVGLHLSGAFSEYVSVPANNCHNLSDTVSFEEASLAEPLAVAVHAVTLASLETDEDVCILGSGAVGLMALQVVNDIGAEKLFVIDTLEYRLDLAKKLGAIRTINAKKKILSKKCWLTGESTQPLKQLASKNSTADIIDGTERWKGGNNRDVGCDDELDMLDVTVKEIE